MKLDRNISPGHVGKYALIKLRDLPPHQPTYTGSGNEIMNINASCVDFGDNESTEFFVIRLKDKYAANALFAYALSARHDDPEYAQEVRQLAEKAKHHRLKTRPS